MKIGVLFLFPLSLDCTFLFGFVASLRDIKWIFATSSEWGLQFFYVCCSLDEAAGSFTDLIVIFLFLKEENLFLIFWALSEYKYFIVLCVLATSTDLLMNFQLYIWCSIFSFLCLWLQWYTLIWNVRFWDRYNKKLYFCMVLHWISVII